MHESYKPEGPEEKKEKWQYFSGTPDSKEFVAAKKFTERFVDGGKYEDELTNTPENIQKLIAYIESLGSRLMPGAAATLVVEELKKAGVITEAVKVKKEKVAEVVKTEYVKLEGPKEVEVSDEELKLIEANLLHEEVERGNVFKNSEELDSLYQKSLDVQQNRLESEKYYFEFSDAGLIKGGEEEVKSDIESLEAIKKAFQPNENLSKTERERAENAKKIATITERALAYGVTELSWYGENVTIEPVSEFDDIRRGVDDILEIHRGDDENAYMALGIDVTFRGLHSEQFKRKFFNLLQSIKDGHKTRVKYFKNNKGEPMKEFAIPKMVLYFNVSDVKEMVSILRDGGENHKDSAQKVNILNQVIHSCTILAKFAEESQNNIFRRYVAVMNSLKELGWENPEIQKILDAGTDTEVTKHMSELAEEFKLIEMQKESIAA